MRTKPKTVYMVTYAERIENSYRCMFKKLAFETEFARECFIRQLEKKNIAFSEIMREDILLYSEGQCEHIFDDVDLK